MAAPVGSQNTKQPTFGDGDGFDEDDANEPKPNMENEPEDDIDDTDFDDEDEEDDLDISHGNADKKEIQTLAGKLSQALIDYNNEQSEPDVELNKYVGGMINKQVGKGLTQKDKDSIIKKLGNDSDSDKDGDALDKPDNDDDSSEINENFITEIINDVVSGIKEPSRKDDKIRNKKITPGNPFVSKR